MSDYQRRVKLLSLFQKLLAIRQMLLEAGADPNVETVGAATQHSALLSPRPPAHAPHQPAHPATSYTPPTAGNNFPITNICLNPNRRIFLLYLLNTLVSSSAKAQVSDWISSSLNFLKYSDFTLRLLCLLMYQVGLR